MSQIKLKHSGGNGVIIAAPSSNPAADRTLLLPGDGDSTIDTLARAGNSLQVVQTVKTDTFTMTGTTFTDVTGLSVTITPSSSSSKVLIIPSLSIGAKKGARHGYRILRGSTAIGVGDSSGSRTQYTQQAGNLNSDTAVYSNTFLFLDSPATTSATTYKVQLRSETDVSGYEVYINRSDDDQDNASYGRSASTITAIEVSA
tara:strand:+ start:1624 stop:2226 length:603 start_codon:yes stop_codon:yes gene_type:complete